MCVGTYIPPLGYISLSMCLMILHPFIFNDMLIDQGSIEVMCPGSGTRVFRHTP